MAALPPIPRLPLVGDPLRRIRVPADLDAVTHTGPEEDPADAGMTRDQVEAIWRSARRLYRSGVHPALQLCVRRDGHVVLNRAIGHARGNGPHDDADVPKVAVDTDTPFVIFSASKAITAMVVHLLDQRGALHIGDRVADYIPEYARNGKDAITLAHVLSHRAGVPNLPGDVMDVENLADHDRLVQILCDAKPASRPGKTLAYHAISGGFILGEVVQRVTGEDIRTVLQREILDPLGFRFTNFGVAPEDVARVGRCYATGARPLPPVSTVLERALGKKPDDIVEASNDPRFLTGIIPAGNGVASAFELSRFFELLRRGGELDGVRIFDERTILRARSEQSYREFDLTLGFPTRYGLGFMLGAELLSLFGPRTDQAFGHLGYTNTIGWADPQRSLAAALVTSGKPVLYPELPDVWALMRRIGRCVPFA
ncbi:MAG: hydrolase [Solirubrobacterales bacterium]|nr:hydrolase [Solirubrobacterales bacterium]